MTIEELLDVRDVKMPQTVETMFKKAEKIRKDHSKQGGLYDDADKPEPNPCGRSRPLFEVAL